MMLEVKRLFDPTGLLNPGVILSDDPQSYLRDLNIEPTVESEVDWWVECGYFEPTCPSKDITLTPWQRIVVRRDIQVAEQARDARLAAELRDDYEYDGVQTCAVDGLCSIACPVNINRGDLVRRLRAENRNPVANAAWAVAATAWQPVTRAGGGAHPGEGGDNANRGWHNEAGASHPRCDERQQRADPSEESPFRSRLLGKRALQRLVVLDDGLPVRFYVTA